VTLRRFNHRDLLAVDGPHNAVGLDYLSRFHVTFDFRNAQACLHCGARFDDPSQIDLSGLLLERVDGETTVHAVRDGGAAARAGMVPGDCILSIDGVPATELSMLAVRRAFSADDRILHLTVRRGRRHHAIEFQLPAQFDANVID